MIAYAVAPAVQADAAALMAAVEMFGQAADAQVKLQLEWGQIVAAALACTLLPSPLLHYQSLADLESLRVAVEARLRAARDHATAAGEEMLCDLARLLASALAATEEGQRP